MNIRLELARIWLPASVRKEKIGQLVGLTARSFETPFPDLRGGGVRRRLEEYAAFTRAQVDRATAEGIDLAGVRIKLRRGAADLGAELKTRFKVTGQRGELLLLRLAYRVIGIDLEADAAGGVIVRRCSFARFYNPETCRVISALDEGLMAGILGEGVLEFDRRITEGHDGCRAVFRFGEGRQ